MPTSKHLWMVAILSASLTPTVVTPAIGQHPRATAETVMPDWPKGRCSRASRDIQATILWASVVTRAEHTECRTRRRVARPFLNKLADHLHKSRMRANRA